VPAEAVGKCVCEPGLRATNGHCLRARDSVAEG
jgi:hypothetical protein